MGSGRPRRSRTAAAGRPSASAPVGAGLLVGASSSDAPCLLSAATRTFMVCSFPGGLHVSPIGDWRSRQGTFVLSWCSWREPARSPSCFQGCYLLTNRHVGRPVPPLNGAAAAKDMSTGRQVLSYTHLTLPTIYSV